MLHMVGGGYGIYNTAQADVETAVPRTLQLLEVEVDQIMKVCPLLLQVNCACDAPGRSTASHGARARLMFSAAVVCGWLDLVGGVFAWTCEGCTQTGHTVHVCMCG